jgi:hypothetical protein
MNNTIAGSVISRCDVSVVSTIVDVDNLVRNLDIERNTTTGEMVISTVNSVVAEDACKVGGVGDLNAIESTVIFVSIIVPIVLLYCSIKKFLTCWMEQRWSSFHWCCCSKC